MKNTLLGELNVDFASPTPVYEQISRKIKHAIAKGMISVNEALPSIREMAGYLQINPNTVARAYRELSNEGIINGRAGKGYWVEKIENLDREKENFLREEFLELLEKAVEIGLSPDSIKKLVDDFFVKETGS